MDWKSVMFTDSKYFHYTYQPQGRQAAVWCKAGEKPILPKLRKSQKVHVYAGISYYGVTPLFFVHGTSGARDIETSVTSKGYIKILNDCLIPSFKSIMEPKVTTPIF